MLSKVAVIPTTPQTVVDDYSELLDLIEYQKIIDQKLKTIIKINLSWTLFYPACSTPPWQLDGVLNKLVKDGYSKDLECVENQTVVTHPWKGAYLNKWLNVLNQYEIPFYPLTNENWVTYKPKSDMIGMYDLFKEIIIPKKFMGNNMIHLPTVKCVHPDTEIFLGDGSLTTISELIDSNHSIDKVNKCDDGDLFSNSQIDLFSFSESGLICKSKTSRMWKTISPQFLFTIRTKTGKELIVSENHPFYTPIGWRKTKDMKTGDRIAIPRKLNFNGKKQKLPKIITKTKQLKNSDINKIKFKPGSKYSIDQQREIIKSYIGGQTTTLLAKNLSTHPESIRSILKRYEIPIHWVSPPFIAPTETSIQFWEWMGYFLSEGYVSDTSGSMRIWFCNTNEIIKKEYLQLTKTLFNLEPKLKKNDKDFYFDSNEFSQFLSLLGLMKKTVSNNKKIPRLLFKCSKEEIFGFIRSFYDGDGGIEKDGIHATTKSKHLAKDLSFLLQRVGIISFLKKTKIEVKNVEQTYWKISIYGEDVITFGNHVKLKIGYKQQKLEELIENRKNSRKPTNWDTIPVDNNLFKFVRESLGFTQQSSGKPSSVNSIENNYSLPSRSTMNYFINLFESKCDGRFEEEIKYFKRISSDHIAWDHIEEINKTKSDVQFLYDFSVDNTNSFIGNGTILHNTHGHTVTTGAMKNAFGGLIPKFRHHSHRIIDEVLVDLLAIQKEIHPGLLAVMDGSVSGNGAGPRTMIPYYSNTLLASEDQVAVDAISAKLMGFDPLSIKYIKLAHDKGLGMGDIDQIEIIGMDKEKFNGLNFNFETKKSIVIKWDQRIRKTTHKYRVLRPLHWLIFYTPLFRMNIWASYIFHDLIWYPTSGKKHIKKFNESDWGKLFQEYPYGEKMKKYPKIKNWNPY